MSWKSAEAVILSLGLTIALTTERPYRTALTSDGAIAELRREAQAGRHFEEIVEEFAALANHPDFGRLAASPTVLGGRFFWH
jgi:hypothetical protein